MKIDKLKELVLLLISIILIIFLIKYLKIIKYLGILFTILIPLFIGFIYAWILNPLIIKLSRFFSRNISCILLFLLIIVCFSLFLYFLVPMFYKEMMEFVEMFPKYFSKIEIKVESIGFKHYLDNMISFLVNNVPRNLVSLVGSIFKYVGVVLIGLILGLYISMDYEKIIKNIYGIVPRKYKCFFINISQEISFNVRRCVNGTLLIASFVFVLDSVCFIVIGLDSALLLGLVCGITDLIPYIGPYIGGLVAVLVGFTKSRFLGILSFIIVFIVQCIENYVLQPIIMSKTIKISPVLVVVGLLIFGNLFGVFGMLLSTPILAMLKVLVMKVKIVINKCKKDKLDFVR
jgi:predicted PurR-regulated permease PerM